MGTTSRIAMVYPDGHVKAISCHWDGYIKDGVGEFLVKYYKTPEAIDALLALGDLSVLGKTVEHDPADWKYSSTDPDRLRCMPYTDRGEDLCFEEFNSYEDFKLHTQREDFMYLFTRGEWHLLDNSLAHAQWYLLDNSLTPTRLVADLIPPDNTKLKPCPFCGSYKLEYSVKTTGSGFHTCIYCKSCNTYGPRVFHKVLKPDVAARRACVKNTELKAKAVELWNKRRG